MMPFWTELGPVAETGIFAKYDERTAKPSPAGGSLAARKAVDLLAPRRIRNGAVRKVKEGERPFSVPCAVPDAGTKCAAALTGVGLCVGDRCE